MTPDDFTIQETYLEVGDGHTLYIQDWGNKAAKAPIVSLHGGPGSASRDRHKGMFDPTKQRVIFFDQRGCGKSLPYGSLEHNTTDDLIEDIEKIAGHLKLKAFVLSGGSWGSTLALCYALKHPRRVAALVISGVWTAAKAETDWVDKGGFRTFFPDVWERYAQSVPTSHRHDPSAYHFPRILGNDDVAMKQSAYEYDCMEGALLALDDRFSPESFDDFDPAGIRIEVHYFVNGCFIPDRYVLDNAHKLTMPIWMVQGRQDMVCPPTAAYELSKSAPNAQLIWAVSGHKSERETWNVMRTIMLQLSGASA